MKTCVIVNPNAGSSHQFEALDQVLRAHDGAVCWRTAEAGHAEELTARALEEGYEVIAAAGGDGTIHEVVNGLLRGKGRARLGVIPLGTGNDLARTLAIGNDPRDAFALLDLGHVAQLDVMRIETSGRTLYGINAAAGGFSGEVDEMLSTGLKETWGPIAYLIGAASALPELKEYRTLVTFDDEPEEEVDALNILVANGRTVAGGRRVAPNANPEDGLLDVVLIRAGSALEIASVGARFLSGNYLLSPHVEHRRVRRVRIDSRPGMWFNVDGELLTQEPITIEVMPGALEVVVGTAYTPEPAVPG